MKMPHRLLMIGTLAIVLISPSSRAKPVDKSRPYTIGFLVDGPGRPVKPVLETIKKEILDLTKGEFDVRFPEEKQLFGSYSAAQITAGANKLLGDPTVQMVIGVGPYSSQVLARLPVHAKPVIATAIIDPVPQGVPFKKGTSGKKNLTYLSTPLGFERSVHRFREIVPFKKLGVILHEFFVKAFPEVGQKLAERLAKQGVHLVWIPFSKAPDEVISKFPSDCDAAHLLLHPLMDLGGVDRLVSFLNQRRVPSFSQAGRPMAERGVLLGLAALQIVTRRARRIALDVQRVLLGEDLATFKVTVSYGAPELTLNLTTANKIGFQPGWDVLSEAALIGSKRGGKPPRKLSLRQAVREALTANLNVIAASQSVESGIYDVRKAIARYLPSVSGGFSATFIDEDRANPTFGSFERSLTGSLQASQVIFSEKALAKISIQKSLQAGREQGMEALKLEIMKATATAYLAVLKAKTFEQIQKQNLKVTKKNLELARVRRSIGASGLADVYRWETRLANDKRAVIQAVASRNKAEIGLNGLRHRPLEEPFVATMGNRLSAVGGKPGQRLWRYINNPWSFAKLREFMVDEGLKISPELKRVDRSIEAQKRALLSAKLDYGLPTLSFGFSLDHRLWEGGAAPNMSGLAGAGLSFPTQDATSWAVNLGLSWNLLEGGAKYHTHMQTRKELSKLKTQRRALVQEIEQQIRCAMHQAGSSFPGIALSRSAARTAGKSLVLVTDAYSRGARSIIDLIDAQNAALNSDLSAAVAVYDFLTDFVAAQHAVANKDFFLGGEKEHAAWLDRLDRYRHQKQKRPDPNE